MILIKNNVTFYRNLKFFIERYVMNWYKKAQTKETKEIVAATIIINNNKALILKRGPTAPWMPNKWNLAGGEVENNENIQSAAIRECKEESGLSITNLKLFKTFKDPDFDLYIFQAKTNNTNVNMNFENSEYAWVTVNDLPKYDFVPYVKEAITQLLNT